jgi:CubicO group peptidase (beta-lactamase class C family)
MNTVFARLYVAACALCLLMSFTSLHSPAQHSSPEVAPNLHALGNADPAIRWDAIVALTHSGAGAVPSLTRALADPDANVRIGAALALGRIGAQAKGAVPRLVEALKDQNAQVRENSARALGAMGTVAAPGADALVLSLADPDPYVVGQAADALRRIGASALPGVSRTLTSGTPATRWAATIALSKMGPAASPAVAPLISALGDSSDEVRWGATTALGNIGAHARSAAPALLHALSDRDQDVRSGASLALDLIDPPAVDAQTGWRSVVATIDTLVPALMKETHVPGVSIALIQGHARVWSGQFGSANMKSGAPVTEETLFEACSMTKPMFAYVAMKLAEQGPLDLDRPLVSYLEPASLRGQPDHGRMTARMMLSHTSGLPNWRKGDEERDGPLPVTFTPGSRFSYSGEGFYYLQQVVEQITGEPFELYARKTLLDPLGLAHTSFVWTERLDAHIAAGHDDRGAFLEKTRYVHANAAYTLYTSPDDYATFLIAIMAPDTAAQYSLRQGSIANMLAHQVAVPSREPIERPGKAKASAVYWGLGWGINATGRGDIVYHSGANRSGFRCYSQFNPSTGSGIVIMTNGLGGSDLWTRLISRIGNL